MVKRGGPRRRPRETTAFTRMLAEIIPRLFSTQSEFAQKMGLSQAHISRVLNGHDSLSIEQCLKLALLTDIDPEVIWQAVGHKEFVEAHRAVYGPAQRPTIVVETKPEERRILDALAHLDPEDRKFIVKLLLKGDDHAAH